MDRKRISYEQDRALERGRQVARRNQRHRVAEREAAEKAQAERERHLAEHPHEWKNWVYADDYKTETRTCRVWGCGATETRAVRL